jgi:predicted nucleotidyltransferase
MIAAHKTLRFGGRVRGADLDNGRVVIVTVVDRGPLIRRRGIDVSASAADELGVPPPKHFDEGAERFASFANNATFDFESSP